MPSTLWASGAARGAAEPSRFCVTVGHADFMAEFFRRHGVTTAAVDSGSASAPRAGSVEQLRAGELQVICTVDVFNEGLDVPEADTVLMLAPTEFPVVFLQQLGRGLRRSDGKDALTVIGLHRQPPQLPVIKPRTLLALGTGREPGTGKVLQAMRSGDFGLPPGCSPATTSSSSTSCARSRGRARGRPLRTTAGPTPTNAATGPAPSRPTKPDTTPRRPVLEHGHWFALLDDAGPPGRAGAPGSPAPCRRTGRNREGADHQVRQTRDFAGTAPDGRAAHRCGRCRDRVDRAPDRHR